MMLENLTRNLKNGVVGLALLASTACASVTGGAGYGVYIIVTAEGVPSETISAEFDLDSDECKTTYEEAGTRTLKVGDKNEVIKLYNEVKTCKNKEGVIIILKGSLDSEYWKLATYDIPQLGLGFNNGKPNYDTITVGQKKLK